MDLTKNADNVDNTLQKHYKKKEDALYKSIYRFLGYAEKAGYSYTDLQTDENGDKIDLTFGNYKNNKQYYRIKLSDILYNDDKVYENKKNINSNISIEKLINYSEKDGKYEKAQSLSRENAIEMTPRQYSKLFIKLYNSVKDKDLPKIRSYDLNNAIIYSFAAAYGATIISALDNTSLVNNAYYGFLHLGMLFAPFIPLQLSKKTRSLPKLLSLALITWTANSFAYYPIGMLMGHTADNLTDMMNFYKFQIGLGSGSYIDKYGPISLKISSPAKALSYAGRLGIAGILSEFDKISNKIRNKKKEV
ncbi:MAG: hypothetical protein QXL94_05965 [Candidatus Parvarchaeum sp.]